MLAIQSCTSTPRYQLTLNEAAQISLPGKAPEQKKAGETVEVTKPMLIESPGKVSVLVLAGDPSEKKTVKLSLKSIETWGGNELESHIHQKTGDAIAEILQGMTSIQRKLATSDTTVALNEIRELRKKYPEAKYLGFVETAVLVILGEKEAAKILLVEALDAFPNDRDGLALAAEILPKKTKIKVEENEGLLSH